MLIGELDLKRMPSLHTGPRPRMRGLKKVPAHSEIARFGMPHRPKMG
jgi:hypothetical protein